MQDDICTSICRPIKYIFQASLFHKRCFIVNQKTNHMHNLLNNWFQAKWKPSTNDFILLHSFNGSLSTWIRARAILFVAISSCGVSFDRPFRKGGMLSSAWCCWRTSFMRKPRSAITKSPGNNWLAICELMKSSLSEILPSCVSDKKEIAPVGEIHTKHFNVVLCLYEEYIFPCSAKFLGDWALISKQSMITLTFLKELKQLGKCLLIRCLGGNWLFLNPSVFFIQVLNPCVDGIWHSTNTYSKTICQVLVWESLSKFYKCHK